MAAAALLLSSNQYDVPTVLSTVTSFPNHDLVQVDYNTKSNFVHAASRDRFIYGWKWPPEDPEPESEPDSDKKEDSKSKSSTLRSEKSSEKGTSPLVFTEAPQKLEGHSLGVTALASSPGMALSLSHLPPFLCTRKFM